MDSRVDEQTEWREGHSNMCPQLPQSEGNRNILWRDFSVFEKRFCLLFDSYLVQFVFFNILPSKSESTATFYMDVYSYVLWALYFSF